MTMEYLTSQLKHLTSGYSKLHYGFRLDRRMIDSFVEYSILDCVGECLRTTRCYSLNYYKGANYCELNYENKTSVPGKFVENEGWIYSERQDWEKELAGPCSSKVCEINEKCINVGCNSSCQISDCGIPFTTRMTSDSVERWDGIGVERRIHVKCSDEYQQSGSGIFICNRNGKWNYDMSCNGKRLGCFKDNQTRFFEPPNFVRLSITNDLTECTRHCLGINKEYKYIGLQ
ncbi:uncharacterized protein LOC134273472, partial [Saccostrea cucullata]|uniref:uncharacterized protein LOC134273472 n=1 Tax=Saccostrea cuccullata TaxID=36930 RepID=UPI002ED5FA98